MTSIARILTAASAVILSACGSDGSTTGAWDGDGGSGPASGCGSRPEGSYKCAGSYSIEVCDGGEWRFASSCCSVKVGDSRKPPYAATCKVAIGKTNAVECSYAGVQCKLCLPGESCETTCVKCASSYSSSCCP